MEPASVKSASHNPPLIKEIMVVLHLNVTATVMMYRITAKGVLEPVLTPIMNVSSTLTATFNFESIELSPSTAQSS